MSTSSAAARKTPDLSTRQLRAFLALAELRSFTRAAQASHLSQPAFSALIRTLEDAVGTRLFDRDTRSVQLTPEGRLFEGSARRLLDDMGGAMADLADHVERRKGRVRVAALPSLAAGWLPSVFAEFMQTWPGIRVDLDDALSDACIALVRSGQADFALAARARARRPTATCAASGCAPTASTWCAAPIIRSRARPGSRPRSSRPGPSSRWRATAACGRRSTWRCIRCGSTRCSRSSTWPR